MVGGSRSPPPLPLPLSPFHSACVSDRELIGPVSSIADELPLWLVGTVEKQSERSRTVAVTLEFCKNHIYTQQTIKGRSMVASLVMVLSRPIGTDSTKESHAVTDARSPPPPTTFSSSSSFWHIHQVQAFATSALANRDHRYLLGSARTNLKSLNSKRIYFFHGLNSRVSSLHISFSWRNDTGTYSIEILIVVAIV